MARKKNPPAGKRKIGKPSLYTRAKSDAVLAEIQDGGTAKATCLKLDIKPGTFFGWVHDDVDGLSDRYARAQRIGAAIRLEECFEIADDGTLDYVQKTRRGGVFMDLDREHVKRSEMRVKLRMWYVGEVAKGGLSPKRRDAGDSDASFKPLADVLALLNTAAEVKAAQAST